ncbi:MAG: IS4 family transposase [Bdellovibrionia bacterium]
MGGIYDGWFSKELSASEFGDQRLNKRFFSMGEKWSLSPERSIPQTFDDWPSVKAAYRFFENKKVTPEKILYSHFENTHQRLQTRKTVLIIQDTSFLSYGHHRNTKGLGKLGSNHRGDQKYDNYGLIMHTALAVDPSGLPLGLVDQKIYARQAERHLPRTLSSMVRAKIPIEMKESIKWIEPMERLSLTFQNKLKTQIVHVGDREADFFELFWRAKQLDASILIRCSHNHVVGSRSRKKKFVQEKLIEKARTQPAIGGYTVEIQETKDRKGRMARVEVSIGSFTLNPERNHSLAKSNLNIELSLHFICVREVRTPQGEQPIEWILLSNIESHNLESAIEKVQWYSCRWQIEIFHKILKSGFRIESCQINCAEKLSKSVHFMSILAWRVHWLTWIARIAPETPAAEILTPVEIAVINARFPKKISFSSQKGTIALYLVLIAQIGGFLARTGDGKPGIISIWTGWSRLADMALGWNLKNSNMGYG